MNKGLVPGPSHGLLGHKFTYFWGPGARNCPGGPAVSRVMFCVWYILGTCACVFTYTHGIYTQR